MTTENRTFGDVGTKLILDNDKMRVWELQLEPGQSSELHHHQHDYVMVQIEGDKIAANFEPDSEGTFAGADQLEGPVAPGTVIFAEAGGKETAVNTGAQTFREIVVEVKTPPADQPETTGSKTARSKMLPIQHVSVNVVDFEAALPFYTEALGFEVLPRPDFGFPGAWLMTGNGVQIHLIEDTDFVAPSGPHTAFETHDMAAEINRLRDLGIDVNDAFEMNGVQQTFFFDPSGNMFELNQPATS